MRPLCGSTTSGSWCSQPGLVLLRAPVVVDGDQHGAGLPGGGSEVDGRLAAVGAHLEQRSEAGSGRHQPDLVQRQAFVVGHEALGRPGPGQQFGIHRGVAAGLDPHAGAPVQLRWEVLEVVHEEQLVEDDELGHP